MCRSCCQLTYDPEFFCFVLTSQRDLLYWHYGAALEPELCVMLQYGLLVWGIQDAVQLLLGLIEKHLFDGNMRYRLFIHEIF